MSTPTAPARGPQSDTYRRLLDARQHLASAESRLHALRSDPRATADIYDELSALIAKWAAESWSLLAQCDAEMDTWYALVNAPATEPETIIINGETFAIVALNVDCPGDVTHRDVERRQPGETFGDTIARLLAKACIEGLQLLTRPGDDAYFFCRSSSDASTLYRINRETLHCTCPASGLCKHRVMVATLTEQIDRLSALYRFRPAA